MENKNENEKEKENYFGEEKANTILAVDLGTTTGWAIKNEFGITSGSMSFKPNRFEGGGMRYLRFQQWLNNLPHVSLVYFEEVRRHLGVDAAHAYGGFLSHLTSWCERLKIPYQGIPVGTIKRFITGKGNASKLEMIKSMEALGHRPTDDNEADALALIHLAVENLSSAKKIFQEARLDKVFEWMTWVTVEERKLIWKRAAKMRWKVICWELGCSEVTANKRWNTALNKIAKKLNILER